MKKLLCLLLTVSALLQPTFAHAEDFTLTILRSVFIDSDFGNPVNTFEDVDPITGIKASFADNGPITGQSEISSKFQGFARKSTVDDFFARLLGSGGLIFKSGNMDFASFLAAHFYLDAGSKYIDEGAIEPTWHEQKTGINGDLPFADYETTARPHERIYNFCLDANYQYIKPFPQPAPNAISCVDHRQFC
ncbi:MAG: hypothetical protein ACD_39C01586G0003, partial [uncultured bacterium]